MSEEHKPKIKEILKEKFEGAKENASLFMEIAKGILVDEVAQSLMDNVELQDVDLDGIVGPLDLLDFADSFAITLSALNTVGMDEELFDELMLKFYFFVKNYFFGEQEKEATEETHNEPDEELRE